MKKKKILITGFSGFVSRHFVQYLYEENVQAEIWGIDISEPNYNYNQYKDMLSIHFEKVNLLDIEGLHDLFSRFIPDYVLHLASYSSVAYSWQFPSESFRNNTNIFLNLVMSIKEVNSKCRILSVGSSEEYGNVEEKDIPLSEEHILKPNSPYAVARVSQEMLSKVFSESYHMNIILTRSFNHIGPYQDERFVVPSFIRRSLNLCNSGKSFGKIETGDTSIIRDFVDVRDVVKAYYELLEKGIPGEIYNICSGKGVSLQDVIDGISKYLNINIIADVNEAYVRPNDNKVIIGSASKIHKELGWHTTIPLNETLHDMIETMKAK